MRYGAITGGIRSWRRCAVLVALAIVLTIAVFPAAPAGAADTRIVGAQSVHVRACPATDCDVVGTAWLGSTVRVTGPEANGFLPVQVNGMLGFVHRLYIGGTSHDPWLNEGQAGCQRIAMIFNIGIGYEPSQTVLDTLLTSGVDATMFPMGWWALQHPDYMRGLETSGFVIGTHGHDSLHLTQYGTDTVVADIETSANAIESVIGRQIDPWFTPYAADTSPWMRGVIADLGYTSVGWRVPAADYGSNATAESVYAQVVPNTYDGAILEFHLDGPATEQSTAVALPWIIADLQAAGYQFVTVPELATPCS